MNDVLKQIELCGIVPVVKIEDAEKAVPLCKALMKGGIMCAEITFRTAAAADAIRRITAELPEMLVGAGTVLTREQADAAVDAGAKFIVSPGFNPENVRYCLSKGVTVVPGCATCGEMEQAMALGLDTVKFFPAEANGGAAAIKAMSAPYKGLRFMPTGGVSLLARKNRSRADKHFGKLRRNSSDCVRGGSGAEGYLRAHNSAFHKRFAKRNCLFCILDFDNGYYSAKFYLL